MGPNVHAVETKDDYETRLKDAGDKLVVVDFYATWCGPCRMISPKFEEFADQITDAIFMKVDIDELEDVACDYNISSLPHFILFKNSEQVGEFCGANAEKLKEMIEGLK